MNRHLGPEARRGKTVEAMRYLRSVQDLRAVAAILVVVFHVSVLSRFSGWTFLDGQAGVDIFFVISGFIMWTTAHRSAPADFMRRRLIRIVPIYWLLTLALAFVSTEQGVRIGVSDPLYHILGSLFFVAHLAPGSESSVEPILQPGWTLNLEMFFYVMFAVCLWLVPRHVFPVLLGLLAALASLGALLDPASPVAAFYLDGLLIEFAFGLIIGRAFTHGGWLPSGWLALALGVLSLAMIGPLVDGSHRAVEWGVGAALLMASAVGAERAGIWPRFRPMEFLGDASYSIYLTHVPVILLFDRVLVKTEMSPGPIADVLIVALCLLVGAAFYLAVERSLGRQIRKFTS